MVNLMVEDVDALHPELVARDVRIDRGPVDQTWAAEKCMQKTPTATVSGSFANRYR
jgi:hypothetical protein